MGAKLIKEIKLNDQVGRIYSIQDYGSPRFAAVLVSEESNSKRVGKTSDGGYASAQAAKNYLERNFT